MSDTAGPAASTPPLDRKRVQEFARTLFGHYTSGFASIEVHDVPGTQNSLFVCRSAGA